MKTLPSVSEVSYDIYVIPKRPKDDASHQSKQFGVTFRAILIGILLIPPNTYFIMANHLRYWSTLPTTMSLIYNVVITLTLLTGLNFLVKLFLPRFALRQAELLTIYVILSLSSAISGHDMMQTVIPTIPNGFWFATPENEWHWRCHFRCGSSICFGKENGFWVEQWVYRFFRVFRIMVRKVSEPMFPFHPTGYAVASSMWTFGWLWFSVFISWTAKNLILRFGGIRLYHRVMPLFLGLILGEFMVGGAWVIVRLIWGVSVYSFYR